MTQDPEAALAQEAVEGRDIALVAERLEKVARYVLDASRKHGDFSKEGLASIDTIIAAVELLRRVANGGSVPIPPDAQHLGG